jgi:hypothetical protein
VKIDDRVEALVRAALDAAVHRDVPRFDDALQALQSEATLEPAIELVLSIAAFVLFETHGGNPTAEQITALAGEISRQEDWAAPAAQDIEVLLTVVNTGDPAGLASLSSDAAVIAFLVAANLLTTASRPDDGEWWFNYLDKVEAAIEAAP